MVPIVEEQLVADSSTRNAILTKRKGKTIASTSTTGRIVRLEIRRAAGGVAVAGHPLPAAELDMVTRLIPDVDM
ncbi:hypothetical protein TIFTF001_024014 [Ficus carica]|uniref:Uncharacterized protein n=1 Tax=Ficus carica TaxID=3494 RepID=A0AA88ALG6_FICCA|nr:hypothetical protein TIFTF001_024014 [Ficus carica]